MDEDGEPATQADFDIGFEEVIVQAAAETNSDEHKNDQMEGDPPDEENDPSSQPNSQELDAMIEEAASDSTKRSTK